MSREKHATDSRWHPPPGGQQSLDVIPMASHASLSPLSTRLSQKAQELRISSPRWRSGVSRDLPLIQPQSRSLKMRLYTVPPPRASSSTVNPDRGDTPIDFRFLALLLKASMGADISLSLGGFSFGVRVAVCTSSASWGSLS